MSEDARTGTSGEELVVLLDESGAPVGTQSKASVHSRETPLHLAFSVHLRGPDGRVLLTRRALSKATWPGVWTNAFCGHPAPGEDFPDAISRRAAAELRLAPSAISAPRAAVPGFRYRAVDATGTVENEVCPVYVADLLTDPSGLPEADPAEVAEHTWVEVGVLARIAGAAPALISPWLVQQLAHPELLAALRSP